VDEQRYIQALNHFESQNFNEAGRLFAEIVKDDPECAEAWFHLAQCFNSPEKKKYCEERYQTILSGNEANQRGISPLHTAEQDQQGELVTAVADQYPMPPDNQPRFRGRNNSSFGIPIPIILAVFVAICIALLYTYYNINTSLLGLARHDLTNYAFSENYQTVNDLSDEDHWQIVYENNKTMTFNGLARHASPIRLNGFPFLTHDILITTDEFSDAAKVSTRVIRHHFYWESKTTQYPDGTINLLHTVPLNDEIYHQLMAISSGENVIIRGREIDVINAYNANNNLTEWWRDDGCNSILVTAVEFPDQ
jgi:hypothetical protein